MEGAEAGEGGRQAGRQAPGGSPGGHSPLARPTHPNVTSGPNARLIDLLPDEAYGEHESRGEERSRGGAEDQRRDEEEKGDDDVRTARRRNVGAGKLTSATTWKQGPGTPPPPPRIRKITSGREANWRSRASDSEDALGAENATSETGICR